jgi:hypothetical protein
MPKRRTQHAAVYRPPSTIFVPRAANIEGSIEDEDGGDIEEVVVGDELWVYGGRDQEDAGDRHRVLRSDVFVYSFTKQSWHTVALSDQGAGGGNPNPNPNQAGATGNGPYDGEGATTVRPDTTTTANADRNSNSTGGGDDGSGADADAPDSNSNQQPPPRYGHTAVHHNNKLIVFGGRLDLAAPGNSNEEGGYGARS